MMGRPDFKAAYSSAMQLGVTSRSFESTSTTALESNTASSASLSPPKRTVRSRRREISAPRTLASAECTLSKMMYAAMSSKLMSPALRRLRRWPREAGDGSMRAAGGWLVLLLNRLLVLRFPSCCTSQGSVLLFFAGRHLTSREVSSPIRSTRSLNEARIVWSPALEFQRSTGLPPPPCCAGVNSLSTSITRCCSWLRGISSSSCLIKSSPAGFSCDIRVSR
mmetsp:Transcript_44057/g.122064  ORF Transcript_44057/g.122064 Transcript_44057/m.122064 type:complete len:222 (+) Transcript_44057:810-1475(+)